MRRGERVRGGGAGWWRPICLRTRAITIIDRREIDFDARALIGIITDSLPRAQAIGLPPQRPIRIEFDPEGNRIICHYDGHEPAALGAEPLGALLVSYCIRSHIPLPHLPEKAIRIGAHSAVIALVTRYGDVPPSR